MENWAGRGQKCLDMGKKAPAACRGFDFGYADPFRGVYQQTRVTTGTLSSYNWNISITTFGCSVFISIDANIAQKIQ
jgi:hypothetical protein